MWKERPRTRKRKSSPVTLQSRHIRQSQQSVSNRLEVLGIRAATGVFLFPPDLQQKSPKIEKKLYYYYYYY